MKEIENRKRKKKKRRKKYEKEAGETIPPSARCSP
jgi:hypothetical protein